MIVCRMPFDRSRLLNRRVRSVWPWACCFASARVSGAPEGVTVPSVVCTTVCSVVMNSVQRRLERREIVGECRAEAVIGWRGRDRRSVQQGQGGCIGLGDFEVVGACGSPTEARLLHLAIQQVDIAIAGLGGLALQGCVDCALDAGRGGGQFLGVGVDGVVEDALQRGERGGRFVLPEVLRDARDLAADRAVEHIAEYGFLNGCHVHADAGDICLIAPGFAHGDGAAGWVAGLVAG